MEWIKKRYDQFILVLLALLLLAFSVLLILRAMSFQEVFAGLKGEVTKNTEVQPLEVGALKAAESELKEPPQWRPDVDGGSLFVSRQYLVKDGQLKSPEGEMFYPPVPNEWIQSNQLDLLDPGVLGNDPDEDRFTNLDEWQGKTNPTDKQSHPPFYTKLRLKEYIKKPFRLLFPAYDGNPLDPSTITFQINTLDVRQPTQFLKMGDAIEGTKFKIDAFEYKTFTDENNVRKDISELILVNTETGGKVTVVLEKITDSPDSYALFHYLWDGSEFQVKKEGTFKLPPDGTEYELIDISADKAVIKQPKTEEMLTIPKLE